MLTQADYSSQLIAFRRTETALELERQGYATTVEERIDGHQADLVARKGQKTLVYEFKVAGSAAHLDADQILQLRAAAIQRGFEFHLVMVAPPERPTIDVQNLAAILRDRILLLDPGELFGVAGGRMEVEVSEVEISEIEVSKEEIDVSGRAVAAIDLQYGGDDEAERLSSFDFYPLKFALSLDRDLNVTNLRQLEIDTSPFSS